MFNYKEIKQMLSLMSRLYEEDLSDLDKQLFFKLIDIEKGYWHPGTELTPMYIPFIIETFECTMLVKRVELSSSYSPTDVSLELYSGNYGWLPITIKAKDFKWRHR